MKLAPCLSPSLLFAWPLLLWAALFGNLHLHASEAREIIGFNRDWTYHSGEQVGAERDGFDSSDWEPIGLPHSFSIPYFAAGKRFYVGYGCYRKVFTVPASWQGRRLFLDFDGVFQVAEVFVNGAKVGQHQGGYTGFEIEITAAIKTGQNSLLVRVNNLWNPQLAPRGGEHAFSGGIYRNVRLVVTDPLHVTWYGSAVVTPSVTPKSADAWLTTEVINQAEVSKSCVLVSELLDPQGNVQAKVETKRDLPAGETAKIEQQFGSVPHPALWAPEHPELYRIVTTLSAGGVVADRYETTFGFRSIRWTADQGFFLNGEHRYFRGANVHQDHAGWGDAVTEQGAARDVQMIKDAGFDFIRGSHYPHSPAFSRACDERGVMLWSENCFWATAGSGKDGYWDASGYPIHEEDERPFAESVRASLRDMIRIHRNHPSIVAWSMGNEVFFSRRDLMPKVRALLQELVDYSHQLDPTRPAAVGGVQRGEIDRIGDVAGYNGDGARMDQYLNPGVPNVVSEYGSTSADRPGEYAADWGDLRGIKGMDTNTVYPWRFAWRSGEAIWCGFDHGSIAGREFGAMGLVDYFRLPKRSWYWYRHEYRGLPPPEWPKPGVAAGLRLSADRTILHSTEGLDDALVEVKVVDAAGNALSNCPPVTLTVEAGPGEFPTGPRITFEAGSDIPVRDGSAAIEFRSYWAGETVIRATSPGLESAQLRIITQGEPKFVAGVTPTARSRPYRRFGSETVQEELQLFGQQSPTRVSSEAKAHPGRMANDGDRNTCWEPSAEDKQPWLSLDLERLVRVHSTKVVFGRAGSWHYRIEASADGSTNWQVVSERILEAAAGTEQTEVLPAEVVRARFVRITLLGGPPEAVPAVAEFEVWAAAAPE